jgi:hypothetical protein
MTDRSYHILILLLIFTCAGCGSRVPYATTFPFQTQRKVQAAKHWQVLAEDLVGQVKACIAERKELMVMPVYVVPKRETPFDEIFHEILISQLVSDGVMVSGKERGAMKMEYNTKLLVHSDRAYEKFPFKFTTLGVGIKVARDIADWMEQDLVNIAAGAGVLADIGLSHHAGAPPNKEIIITTSLSLGDYFLMHRSDIYYINTPDAGHYVNAPKPESQGVDGRTFDVVN